MLRQWGSWWCHIIGYHQPYLLQNRNPTHVHLWPSVRALNIHQKCIKFADCYSFPTPCQAPDLFLLRGFLITLNRQWSLLTLTALKEVTTWNLFSACICVCVCMWLNNVPVFSLRLSEVPSARAEPFHIVSNLLEPRRATPALPKHESDLQSAVTSHRKM